MKKGLWVLAAAMVLFFAAGRMSFAFWGQDNKKAEAAKAAPAKVAVEKKVEEKAVPAEVKEAKAPAVHAPSAAELEKQRALRDKKKSLINNNQWDVDIMPLSGKGNKQSDTLVFRDSKFSSVAFGKSGFAPSNYTLTMVEDGSAVIETMQSSEKEGIIFWRIEMDKDLAACKGILSRQMSENKTEDFSFSSSGKKPATAEAVVVAPPAAAKTEPKAGASQDVKPGDKETPKKK